MAELGEWLAAISCGSLREPLDDYGCETTADLLLLDTPDERALAVEVAGPGPVGVMLRGTWHRTGWDH